MLTELSKTMPGRVVKTTKDGYSHYEITRKR
jgi:hypothetical protein